MVDSAHPGRKVDGPHAGRKVSTAIPDDSPSWMVWVAILCYAAQDVICHWQKWLIVPILAERLTVPMLSEKLMVPILAETLSYVMPKMFYPWQKWLIVPILVERLMVPMLAERYRPPHLMIVRPGWFETQSYAMLLKMFCPWQKWLIVPNPILVERLMVPMLAERYRPPSTEAPGRSQSLCCSCARTTLQLCTCTCHFPQPTNQPSIFLLRGVCFSITLPVVNHGPKHQTQSFWTQNPQN